MREWLSFPPEPAAWPEAPGRSRVLADDRERDLTVAVADVISATGDTRRLTCLSAGLLACVPGIFGFIAWELLANWRLYRANRPDRLRPVMLGAPAPT